MKAFMAALLAASVSVPAAAQVDVAAERGAAGAGTVVSPVVAVPAAVLTPALTPPLAAAGAPAAVALAPAATSAAAPLPASALAVIDPKTLPDSGKHYAPAEWGKLVESTPGGGAKEILKSMSNAPASSPQLSVTLADGEKVAGRFRGMAGDKMVLESEGRLLGLERGTLDVTKVSRLVDVLFDGSNSHPDEVVVHDRPAVVDPFKDLSAYKGRVVDVDIHDLDDPKWSRQTVSGRVVKADGQDVELEGPKGRWHVQREFHQIDAVALRTDHYAARGKISSMADVNGEVPLGTPVELTFAGGAKPASGLFRGVRKDSRGGLYVVIETPDGRFRGYTDFYDLRTPGYAAGGLLPDSERLYVRAP